MNPGTALKEVWGWKDNIAKKLSHLTREDKIEFIRESASRFSKGINLSHVPHKEAVLPKKT